MKTMEDIRFDLKCVRRHYPGYTRTFSPAWYWDRDFKELDGLRTAFENAVRDAPESLRAVYDGMYRYGKTQKQIAAERQVSEKYIQILHKRLILFFYAYFAGAEYGM